MTYKRDGVVHLDADEQKVLKSVAYLNTARRTTNNSQIANDSGVGRKRVGEITSELKYRGFIQNVGSGAAYHWRITTKGRQYQP